MWLAPTVVDTVLSNFGGVAGGGKSGFAIVVVKLIVRMERAQAVVVGEDGG